MIFQKKNTNNSNGEQADSKSELSGKIESEQRLSLAMKSQPNEQNEEQQQQQQKQQLLKQEQLIRTIHQSYLSNDDADTVTKQIKFANGIKESKKSSNQLSGKNIVLVLGSTGGGKSVFINYTMGRRIVQQEVGNEKQLQVVQGDIEFQIGHKHQTDKISSFQALVNGEELEFCDTPWFFDNRSFFQDFINTNLIIGSLKQGRSIRFLLVIQPFYADISNLRGYPIKILASQFTKIFNFKYYSEIKDSILLVLNHIDMKCDINEYLNQFKQNLERVKQEIESLQEKQFIQLLIEKLGALEYIVFNPLDYGNHLEYQLKTQKLKKINQEQIQQIISHGLSENTKQQLQLHLIKCVDIFERSMKQFKIQYTIDIFSSLSYLNENIQLKEVQEQYIALINKLTTQDGILQQLQSKLKSFYKNSKFDNFQAKFTLEVLGQAMNFYYFAMQNERVLKENNIFSQCNLKDVLAYVQKDVVESILKKFNQSSDLKYKATQIKKFQWIFENQKVKEILQTIRTNILDLANDPLVNDVLSSSTYQAMKKDIMETQIQIKKKIKEVFENEQISEDFSSFLKKAALLQDIELDDDLKIEENEWVDFVQIKLKLFNHIQHIKNHLVSISSQLIEGKSIIYHPDYMKKLTELKKKYEFISFFFQSEDTSSYFRDNQREFYNVQESTINNIGVIVEAGAKSKDKRYLTQLDKSISYLIQFDISIQQRVEKLQCYQLYQSNLIIIFDNENSEITIQLKQVNEKLLKQIYNKNIKELEEIDINELIQIIPKINDQIEQAQRFKGKKIKEVCVELVNNFKVIIDKYIEELNCQDVRFLATTFKKMQVLIAVIKNRRENKQILPKYTDVDFIEGVYGFIRRIKERQRSYHFIERITLLQVEQNTEQIQNLQQYQSFLLNFLSKLLSEVQLIQKICGEIKNSKEQSALQQVIKNNNHTSIETEVKNELNYIDKSLTSFQKLVIQQFSTEYNNFDLNKLEMLINYPVQKQIEILNILLKLKEANIQLNDQILFSDQYFQAQTIVTDQLKKEFSQIIQNRQRDDQRNQLQQYRIILEEYKQKYYSFKNHLLKDTNIDVEKEELKLLSESKQLYQHIIDLICEKRYQQLSEELKRANERQKADSYEVIDTQCAQTLETIKEKIKLFERNPSISIQSEIITNLYFLQEAILYFEGNIQKTLKQNIVKDIAVYYQLLINKLFETLKSKETLKTLEFFYNIMESFLNNQLLRKIPFEMPEFQSCFSNKIMEFYISIVGQAEQCLTEKEDVIPLLSHIDQLIKIVNNLNLQSLLIETKVTQQFKVTKQKFIQIIFEQIKAYFYNQQGFNLEELKTEIQSKTAQYQVTFQIKDTEMNIEIRNFIQEIEKEMENIQKIFNKREFERIVEIVMDKQYCNYVIKLLRNEIVIIKTNIHTKYLNNNDFIMVQNELEILQKYKNTYSNTNASSISEFAGQTEIEINEEIKSIWRFGDEFQQHTFDQIGEINKNLVQILKIMESRIYNKSIYSEKSENLVIAMNKQLDELIKQIESSISELDSEKFLYLQTQLENLTTNQVIMNKEVLNYLNLFEELVKKVRMDGNNPNIGTYNDTIHNLHQKYQLIIKFIKNKQSLLLKQYLEYFSKEQMEEIIKLQGDFSLFYAQIENSINVKQIQKEFIYQKVLEQYVINFQNVLENQTLKNLFQKSQHIQMIEQYFIEYIPEIKQKLYYEAVQQKIDVKLKNIYEESLQLLQQFSTNPESLKQFAQNLINMYKHWQRQPQLKEQIRELMRQALEEQDDHAQDLIYQLIELDHQGAGVNIKDENVDLFQQRNVQWRIEQTRNKNTIEIIKQHMPKDKYIEQQYRIYEDCYRQVDEQIVQGNLSKEQLTNKILELSTIFKQNDGYLKQKKIIWNTQQKYDLLIMLAHLSCLWSILDKKNDSRQQYQENRRRSTRFIHLIQIISIMKLLNIDSPKQSQLVNHVVQIRTGEGKSIALGITSALFALIGFQVDCCCYSPYLSERDYKDFEYFFINFNIQSKIQYNTFSKLAEKIINKPFDMRKLGEKYLNPNNIPLQKDESSNENMILIVDEMDFLFSDNFYGEVYAVGCGYTNKEVVNLFKFIWKKKYRNITVKDILQSSEYQMLFKNHPYLNQLKKLINTKINQIFEDSKKMENHSYVIQRKPNTLQMAIGYKELDDVDYDIVKGYKTSFAYLQEWQKGEISTPILEEKLSFTFNLGCFSYLKMIESYKVVLGVTGTLEVMTNFQKNSMKEICNVKQTTITPSIFGQLQLRIKETKILDTKQQYFEAIIQDIEEITNQDRSVLVFFENNQNLIDFYNSKILNRDYKSQILIEVTQNKNAKIAFASKRQMVTLSTKIFGRGTDFRCYDRVVMEAGGIHCIQVFLSKTLAEENQIKGRVARNGEQGSYRLIVLKSDILTDFNISEKQYYKLILPFSNPYKNDAKLDKIRTINIEKINKILKQKQNEASKYHNKSNKIKQILSKDQTRKKSTNNQLAEIAIYSDSKDIKVVQLNSQPQVNPVKQEVVENNGQENKLIIQGDKTQFENISLLIGRLCNHPFFDDSNFENLIKDSLEVVGVKNIKFTYNEEDFVNQIKNFDQGWIISDGKFQSQTENIEERFVESVLQHLKQKKGLMLLSENIPFYYHTNLLLKYIPIGYDEQTPVFMQMQGDDIKGNTLTRGKYNKRLEFVDHPITKGLTKIYEGSTICYPKVQNNKAKDLYDDFYDVDIIGTSDTQKPCIFTLNGNNERGRIAFDCGFSKMHQKYWKKTPGTEIYFQNCYQWLCFFDNKDQ